MNIKVTWQRSAMMKKSFFFLLLFLYSTLLHPVFAYNNPKGSQIEPLINSYLSSYAFSPDNLFKLAVYTEMKGDFEVSSRSIRLRFGDLGEISFFPNNCLFRTGSQVFSLSRRGNNSLSEVAAMNRALFLMFENISLLANNDADPALVAFVDESLARKNIEPFNKIFVRHILVNYGKYDGKRRQVEFHTDWLPEQAVAELTKQEERLVKKYRTPLMIRLDDTFLRGYYIYSGGTVYVEDVDREVKYATGEEFDPNVTAFKVFSQKLFVQSAQYVSTNETKRLANYERQMLVVENLDDGTVAFSTKAFLPTETALGSLAEGAARRQSTKTASKSLKVKPLYHEYNWIGMMLGVLREQRISIADPEILAFLVDKPYFERIYQQLTPEERTAVDRTRNR